MAETQMANASDVKVLIIFIDGEQHALVPYLNEVPDGRTYRAVSYCRKTFVVQPGTVRLAYHGAIQCVTCRTRAAQQQFAL
jgi:hypothetical protein